MRIFDEKQYEELKVYGKQIEDYIRKEICPKIKYQIMLQVGTEETKMGNPRYKLIVDKNTIQGYSGHLGICFNKEDMSKEIGRDDYVYDSWNYGANYLYQLCSNWKDGTNIKQQLLNAVAKFESEKGKVFENFSV